MYTLVDNKMNMCWAFQDSKKEIEALLHEQKNPSFYRDHLSRWSLMLRLVNI